MNLRRPFIFAFLIVSAFLIETAQAHPVAQGSMIVNARPGAVDLTLRVSNEQVFVASVFAESESKAAPAPDLSTLWREHAAYLLAHLKLEADGTPLTGQFVKLTEPKDTTVAGFVTYDLTFPLADATTSHPGKLIIRQDVLNEIEFAPGNRWEATFVARLEMDGVVVREGELFSNSRPIDWTVAAPVAGAATLSNFRIAREYLLHGIHHILGGWDHLLFMTALVLGVATFWDLLAVVTAFTLAHTVTLTLAALRIVNLPSSIVEPMIAASIVAVAAQNLFAPKQTRGWPRFATAFGFGLFHGLGFAGGLLDAMADLPGTAITAAIAAFSVGVEIGHEVVVLPLFGLVLLCRYLDSHKPAPAWHVARLRTVGSILVLAAGSYYLTSALRASIG